MGNEAKETKIEDKPKAGAGDAAHLAVRVILSSIPGVGGATKEIFNTVIAPPLARRQTQWMESIANRLIKLEEKVTNFKIIDLSKNENFISSVFYATTIAVRSHQEEKLDALRNAVLNAALSSKIDEDLQHMFLNFVDELTPWHLRILKYFDSPNEWLKQREIVLPHYTLGGAATIFFEAFPELKDNRDFAQQLVTDLSAKGLSLDWSSMNVMVSRESMFSPRTTKIGKSFLGFITSPIME